MKNIKQQFKEFKETTPKYIQWLLLAAAFVVVIILFVLLLDESRTEKTVITSEKSVDLSFKPERLTFDDVKVDEKLSKKTVLSVSGAVVIDKTYIKNGKSDWDVFSNCEGIKDDTSCTINVSYTPHTEHKSTETSLIVEYHLPDNDADKQEKKLSIKFNAIKVETQGSDTEEPIEDEPAEEEPVIDEPIEDEPVEDEPAEEEPVIDEPIEDEPVIEDPIEEEPIINEPNIAPKPEFPDEKPSSVVPMPSEKCSDFAIPGYNKAGVQIGWIKPSHGANYFHPFSDKDCTKPTGRYDWTTGVITSLKDGSKMGTDADHIGFRNVKTHGLTLPNLSEPERNNGAAMAINGHFDEETANWGTGRPMLRYSSGEREKPWVDSKDKIYQDDTDSEVVISSQAHDRSFILRQFKPIPATIVSEVRADPSVYGCTSDGSCDEGENHSIPVRATVDRNVFSDDGRTIIIPTGTLLMGYLEGNLPGPYQSFGRMNIKWYQFIRPDGIEFNFDEGSDPYSGDAQGRVGVPGRGSTDYIEQMVMPILTAIVPAAVNMIAPIADTFVNQINLDSNTVVQTGTMRSSEMAKQELINQWNRITNKLVVDAISNTVPPFSIPAGTRINVYSPVDLAVTCGDPNELGNSGKKCAIYAYGSGIRRPWRDLKRVTMNPDDPSWVGQVRSWDLSGLCTEPDKDGKVTLDKDAWKNSGTNLDYRTALMYCESQTYQAINQKKQEVYHQQQVSQFQDQYMNDEKAYNTDILGLQYADDGETILNPWESIPTAATEEEEVLTCDDGSAPDDNGCCPGETYTNLEEEGGFFCCPDNGEKPCFPPLTME